MDHPIAHPAPSSGGRRRHRAPCIGPRALAAPLLLLLVLTSCTTARTATPQGTLPRVQQTAPSVPLVVTYFYYWYDLPNGSHSTELTDHPADPHASYKSIAWLRQQLADMQYAGIDVALPVYWGPEEPSSDVGLANIVRADDELRQSGASPPHLGMFLDTGALGNWPANERNLTTQRNFARFYQLIHTFFTIVPRSDWALIDGRPILWLWAAYFNIDFDQHTIDKLTTQFFSDFGIRPYIVAEISWVHPITSNLFGTTIDQQVTVRLDAFYEWGAALHGYHDTPYTVAEVGPGFDERSLSGSGRSGRHIDRQGGAFYTQNLQKAIAARKSILALETWDEFHEATDIADSREYGRQYIDITRQYTALFKNALNKSTSASTISTNDR